MALNPTGQTEENMKILKDLEEQKKKLKSQQPSPGTTGLVVMCAE